MGRPQERRLEGVSHARRETAHHLVGRAVRAPLVAIVEHDADAFAEPRQRREQELREGRTADEHDIGRISDELHRERCLGRRLPEDLRIGYEQLLGHGGDGPGQPRDLGGRGARLPCRSLLAIRRLERPHAHDLQLTRKIALERCIAHGHGRIRHGKNRRGDAVGWEILHELEHALHAGPADGRKAVRRDEHAQWSGVVSHAAELARAVRAARPASPLHRRGPRL